MVNTGYTKSRWQEAKDAEGVEDPVKAREVHRVLRLGVKAVPLLIGCITDEKKTEQPVWDFWPETRVGDIAFSILCDLFSDPARHLTLEGVITWEDLKSEMPEAPAWTAWENYISKHGRRYVQRSWLRAWSESKGRIYWDKSALCFKVKGRPGGPVYGLAPVR